MTIDLDSFALRSGGAERLELRLRPEPPVVGGERLEFPDDDVEARLDISRTSSGYALRLRASTEVAGDCARCLGPAVRRVDVDAREVDQPSTEDPELRSPYVGDGLLDVDSWTHDAITLAIPERLLCRDDCAGLCEVCGVSLNDFEPGQHSHESPPDPRFAKLRELIE